MSLITREAKEPDYAAIARAAVSKQHERVREVMVALVQHIGFIRPCDWTPEEKEALEFAQRFLGGADVKKPMGREEGKDYERSINRTSQAG